MILIQATPDITIRPDMLAIFVTLLLAILGGIFWMIKMLYAIAGRTTNSEIKIADNSIKITELDKRLVVHDGCSAKTELKYLKQKDELIEQDLRALRVEIQNSFDKYNEHNREDFTKVFNKIDVMNQNFVDFIKEFAKK